MDVLNSSNSSHSPGIVQDVDYISVWELERSVNLGSWRQWLDMNPWFSVHLSLVYLLVIFSGQRVMRNRKPFVLRELLAAWNFLLAGFSVVGFMRTAPELKHIIQNYGLHSSICSGAHHNVATAFWGLLITLSKAVELVDTGFIVLKKKPLTFLSWGHHTMALITTFLGYSAQSSSWRWFIIMNFFVHSIMYTYFGLKTLNFNLSRRVSMFVTFVQTFQMVLGLLVSGYSVYVKKTGGDCFVPLWLTYTALMSYVMLLYLFGNLFINMYIRKKRDKSE